MYSARMATPHEPADGTHDAQYTGMRLDAAALKVLAHPLRPRLLGTLRIGGPATATDLATQLGTNSGATSYHLRRLESVGLVTDTGDGEGKRRPVARLHRQPPVRAERLRRGRGLRDRPRVADP